MNSICLYNRLQELNVHDENNDNFFSTKKPDASIAEIPSKQTNDASKKPCGLLSRACVSHLHRDQLKRD